MIKITKGYAQLVKEKTIKKIKQNENEIEAFPAGRGCIKTTPDL